MTVIFIIGSQKSGTTWLRNCISHVTPISMKSEWYFVEFEMAVRRHIERYGGALSDVERENAVTATVREGWRTLLSTATPEANSDKSAYPTDLRKVSPDNFGAHCQAVSIAKKYFPESKTIVIVRDPRAVYNSLWHFRNVATKNRHFYPAQIGRKLRNRLRMPDPRKFGKTWFEQNSQWIDDNPDVVIRYEDLKTDFFVTMRKILTQTRQEVSDEIIREIYNAEFDIKKSKMRQKGLYRKGEIYDWKKYLSRRTAQQIASGAEPLMRFMKYL